MKTNTKAIIWAIALFVISITALTFFALYIFAHMPCYVSMAQTQSICLKDDVECTNKFAMPRYCNYLKAIITSTEIIIILISLLLSLVVYKKVNKK